MEDMLEVKACEKIFSISKNWSRILHKDFFDRKILVFKEGSSSRYIQRRDVSLMLLNRAQVTIALGFIGVLLIRVVFLNRKSITTDSRVKHVAKESSAGVGLIR